MSDIKTNSALELNGADYSNLYLARGTDLTPIQKSGDTYQYEFINFSQIKAQCYPENILVSDLANKDSEVLIDYEINTIVKEMKEVDSIVYFYRFGSTLTTDDLAIQVGDKIHYVLSPQEIIAKKDIPCGFVSSNGSVIPQIILPSLTSGMVDNGVGLEIGTDVTQYSLVEDWGYDWEAKQMTFDSSSSSETASTEAVAETKLLRPYGQRVAVQKDCGYVTMCSACPNSYLDKNGNIKSREYSMTFDNIQDRGSFAIMLDIVAVSQTVGTGDVPFVVIDVNGGKGDLDTKVTISQTSDTITTIGTNVVNGALQYSDNSNNVPQRSGTNNLMNPKTVFIYPLLNGLVVSGNLSGSAKDTSGSLQCKFSDNSFDIFSVCSPTIADFPNEHSENSINKFTVTENSNTKFSYSDTIKLYWNKCYGSFCYVPIFFMPKMVFTVYFKGVVNEGTGKQDSINLSYYGILLSSQNGSQYVIPDKIDAVVVNTDSVTLETIYKITIEVTLPDGAEVQSTCCELFGFVKVLKKSGKLSNILNQDGSFYTSPYPIVTNFLTQTGRYPATGASLPLPANVPTWMEFITLLRVTHSLEGTSGDLTLDKYAMLGLNEAPLQSIGALTLLVKNGNYKNSTINSLYSGADGQVFTGYAMEVQNTMSESQASIGIKLVGIEKKLEDMKLVNCPYWDGDRLFGTGEGDLKSILNFFISYSGCRLKFNQVFTKTSLSEIRVPRSFDYQKPAVDFPIGTSVLSALKSLAEKTNHIFVIQPDGCGYFYEMDSYGRPYWATNSSNIIKKAYKATDIISITLNPYLENKYNTFITMGYLIKKDGLMNTPLDVGVSPNMLMNQIGGANDTSGLHIVGANYPWSRILSNTVPGNITLEQLQKQHLIQMTFGIADVFQGSVSVPGDAGFYLYDRISIEGVVYYITELSHDFNFQSKEWTTALTLGTSTIEATAN